MAARFLKGFLKTARATSLIHNPKALDYAGLGVLGIPAAVHGYKAMKEKKHGEAALAGAELGGLGLLARSVAKAKH